MAIDAVEELETAQGYLDRQGAEASGAAVFYARVTGTGTTHRMRLEGHVVLSWVNVNAPTSWLELGAPSSTDSVLTANMQRGARGLPPLPVVTPSPANPPPPSPKTANNAGGPHSPDLDNAENVPPPAQSPSHPLSRATLADAATSPRLEAQNGPNNGAGQAQRSPGVLGQSNRRSAPTSPLGCAQGSSPCGNNLQTSQTSPLREQRQNKQVPASPDTVLMTSAIIPVCEEDESGADEAADVLTELTTPRPLGKHHFRNKGRKLRKRGRRLEQQRLSQPPATRGYSGETAIDGSNGVIEGTGRMTSAV